MVRLEGHSSRWLALATLAILAATAAVAVYGSIASAIFSEIWWSAEGWSHLGATSIAFWVSFFALYRIDRKSLVRRLVIGGVLLVAAAGSIGAVGSALLIFVSSLALGNYVLGRNEAGSAPIVDLVLHTAAGLALLTALFSLLALLPVNNRITYALILAVPCFVNGRSALQSVRDMLAGAFADANWKDFLLLGVIANLVVVFLVAALLPERGWDALALHLALAEWVRDYGFWHYDVAKQVFAVTALAGDFMYAAALTMGGETAASLTNVGALILLLVLTYAYVRDIASRRVALIAVLSAASSPLALLESATLHIENVWALFLVGSFIAMLLYRDTFKDRYLLIAAMTFGGAMATKIIALAAAPVLGLILLLTLLSHRQPLLWRRAGFAIAIAAMIALPPYLIALVKTGSPVFPFSNAIFKSPLYDTAANFASKRFPGTFDPLLLYKFTFFSDHYLEARPGALGFTALALLPVCCVIALITGSRRGIFLAVAIVSFAVICIEGMAYIRYLYPLVFLLALLVGDSLASLESTSSLATRALVFVAFASFAANVLMLAAADPPMRNFPIGAVVDAAARERYIHDWGSERRIVEFLNVTADRNSIVAFLGRPSPAGLLAKAVTRVGYTPSFSRAVGDDESAASVLKTLLKFRVDYVVVDSTTPAVQRQAAEELGPPLFEFGDSAIYRIDDRLRFPTELLPETVPSPTSSQWHPVGVVTVDATRGAVKVTVSDLLYAVAAVEPDDEYLLSVVALCGDEPANFRLQIIWLDAAMRRLPPTLVVRPCSASPIEQSAIMRSPPQAAYAVVYATGHEAAPVFIKSVSLRSR